MTARTPGSSTRPAPRTTSRGRRARVAIAATALLAVPALASCGFNYGTDQPYVPAHGGNDRDEIVKVLAGIVVDGRSGTGFSGTIVNNDLAEPVRLETLEVASLDGDDTYDVPSFSPVEVAPGGSVNLAAADATRVIPVSGDLTPGQVVNVTLGFSNGDTATVQAPVVNTDDPCRPWNDITPSAAPAGAQTGSTSEQSETDTTTEDPGEEACGGDAGGHSSTGEGE